MLHVAISRKTCNANIEHWRFIPHKNTYGANVKSGRHRIISSTHGCSLPNLLADQRYSSPPIKCTEYNAEFQLSHLTVETQHMLHKGAGLRFPPCWEICFLTYFHAELLICLRVTCTVPSPVMIIMIT